MKKVFITLLLIIAVLFTLFGAFGVVVSLFDFDFFGIILFMLWSLLGLYVSKKLLKNLKKSKQKTTSQTYNPIFGTHKQTMKDVPNDADPFEKSPVVSSSVDKKNISSSPDPIITMPTTHENKAAVLPEKSSNTKNENHKVAGTSFRQKEIESLGQENSQYYCSKKELIDDYMIDERIYQYEFFPASVQLVEEPDNKYDPNAIKVIIDNMHVGYIKKGSCAHVKKLLRHNRISSITASISGGKYKYISSDYDVEKDEDVYTMETDSVDYFISIDIVVSEEERLTPKSSKQESKTMPPETDVKSDDISSDNTTLFLDEKTLSSLNLKAFLEYAEMITNSAKGATAENIDAYMEELKLIKKETDRRSK